MEGDRREVSLSLKRPVIMSQASLVKQISENVPSVPEFRVRTARWILHGDHHTFLARKLRQIFRKERRHFRLFRLQPDGHKTYQHQDQFCNRHKQTFRLNEVGSRKPASL